MIFKVGDQVVVGIDGKDLQGRCLGEIEIGIIYKPPAKDVWLDCYLGQEEVLAERGIESLSELLKQAIAEFDINNISDLKDNTELMVKVYKRWDELKAEKGYWFYDRSNSYLLEDGRTVFGRDVRFVKARD